MQVLTVNKTDWVISSFLILTLVGSLVGLSIYIPLHGVHPLEPILCATLVFLIAMAISGGYHRYFSHKAFRCHPFLKFLYLFVGAGGFQQSALVWSVDHRFHHRYVDTNLDPYNINRGFWWAHWGWLFAQDPPSRDKLLKAAPDLAKDRWVMWQDRYWVLLGIFWSVVVPVGVGLMIGRPLGMFLWAGLLRIVISHHTTFTVNSIAHIFGKRPYSDKNSARDVWWLAPFLCGEAYHNYHHAFQADYRNGVRWYQWDPTKWSLWIMHHLGMVTHLNRTPEPQIIKARLAMELKRVEQKLSKVKVEPNFPLWENLLKTYSKLLENIEIYEKAKQSYEGFKKNLSNASAESMKSAKRMYHEKQETLKNNLALWRDTIKETTAWLRNSCQPITTP
jgi:stearoyl-CoA desaturase (delta-9 desaturase)